MSGPQTDSSPGPAPVLARTIQVVGVLLAAFGGFLGNVAPPAEAGPAFATGLASFLALGILLYISALAKNQARRKNKSRWLTVAGVALVLAAVLGFKYQGAYQARTFSYPEEGSPDRYVAGTELTADGRAYLDLHQNAGPRELAVAAGLDNRSKVWTTASINRSKLTLTAWYVALVVCLATMVFSLTEGILSNPRPRS